MQVNAKQLLEIIGDMEVGRRALQAEISRLQAELEESQAKPTPIKAKAADSGQS